MKRPLLLLPLALAACAPMMMAPNASTADGLFLQAATGSNLFEIQAAQVALSKTGSDPVRAFAQHMVNDHTTAQNQVAALATRKGVPLPKMLPPELQLKLNTLSGLSGAAFDTAYAREMVLSHQLTVSLLQNEQAAGKDADVVALANQQLPIITQHLTEAQALPGAATPASSTP
ncbi:DUF4142 domain-containing protein [Deinococcus aluminii]|uniref:DUF4142 domain-containing protein n=1 Tax=Deinococcus aluminii TaxID=1656885 RepID=A0ABP9XDL1_9DEIO